MRFSPAVVSYLTSASVLADASEGRCKCTPDSQCWPSSAEWSSLNSTLGGNLIRGVPPGSVCYPDQLNYSPEGCEFVARHWFDSTWHATDPVSIDYPIWTNNSCNPIWPNGTSFTGDASAGERGCAMGAYPEYVVNATSAEHVRVALRWAGEKHVRVVIKNTGHSYQGRSIGYGSLSIWTHHLRGIQYTEDFRPTSCPVNGTFRAAQVAAGHTGQEVQAELAKYNAIVVTGANPDVGIVGWLTGGGHGKLSQTYGMGADNLLEATIVTPNGLVIVTNPCQNSDIFFAIRGGGGGTYGVVTEVVIKAFLTPKTTSHKFTLISLSKDTSVEFYEFIGFLHAELPRLKEGGMQGYYYIAGPPIAPTLSFLWTFTLFDKPNGTVERLMVPIEQYLEKRTHVFVYQQNITYANSYIEMIAGDTNELVATGGSAYGSRLLSPQSLVDANITAQALASIGPSADALKPNGPFSNTILIGHFIASPNIPAYYPEVISMTPAWRNTLVHFIVVSSWPDGISQSIVDSVYHDITYNKTQALRELSPETGAYFNEADSYEPEWQQAFFGKHYAKLLGVKRQYDPENVLWCRRCVGSEALDETPDGRLCVPGYDH